MKISHWSMRPCIYDVLFPPSFRSVDRPGEMVLVTQQPGAGATGEIIHAAPIHIASTAATTQPHQQIIVIPQSLLQGQTKKPLLRVTPSIAPVTAIVSAPPATTQATSTPPQPTMATKICLKRPLAASPSPAASATSPPVRKRANLDHLSADEKLMRRKLKNRVAAQNARDKKRVRVEEMEDLIRQLQEENQALRDQNEQLSQLNQKLNEENSQLTVGSTSGIKEEMPPSPVSLPRSPLPPSPVNASSTAPVLPSPAAVAPAMACAPSPGTWSQAASDQDQTVVVSRVSEPAEPTNVLLPKGQTRERAAEQAATALTAAACLVWTCMQAAMPTSQAETAPSSSGSRQSEEEQSRADAKRELPLKKRSSAWWGARQRSWNPQQTPAPT